MTPAAAEAVDPAVGAGHVESSGSIERRAALKAARRLEYRRTIPVRVQGMQDSQRIADEKQGVLRSGSDSPRQQVIASQVVPEPERAVGIEGLNGAGQIPDHHGAVGEEGWGGLEMT